MMSFTVVPREQDTAAAILGLQLRLDLAGHEVPRQVLAPVDDRGFGPPDQPQCRLEPWKCKAAQAENQLKVARCLNAAVNRNPCA